jgi:hypothetical protein
MRRMVKDNKDSIKTDKLFGKRIEKKLKSLLPKPDTVCCHVQKLYSHIPEGNPHISILGITFECPAKREDYTRDWADRVAKVLRYNREYIFAPYFGNMMFEAKQTLGLSQEITSKIIREGYEEFEKSWADYIHEWIIDVHRKNEEE